jgi:hypothetical protein
MSPKRGHSIKSSSSSFKAAKEDHHTLDGDENGNPEEEAAATPETILPQSPPSPNHTRAAAARDESDAMREGRRQQEATNEIWQRLRKLGNSELEWIILTRQGLEMKLACNLLRRRENRA